MKKWSPYLFVSSLGLAILAVLHFQCGSGITNDSVEYLQAAKSLHNEGTFTMVGGKPFTSWPPLIPFLLSPFTHSMGSGLFWGFFLNCIWYCLLGFLCFRLVSQHTSDGILKVWIYGVIMLSAPILLVHHFIWSEALFICLTLTLLLQCAKRFETHQTIWWLALTALPLTRFIGVALVPWFVWTKTKSIKKTILHSTLALLPVCSWGLYNAVSYSSAIGPRDLLSGPLHERILQFSTAISGQWLPVFQFPLLTWLVFPILLFCLFKARQIHAVLTQFVLFYSFALIILAWAIQIEPLDERLISPIVVPGILIVLATIERLKLKQAYKWTLIVAISAYPLSRSIHFLSQTLLHNTGIQKTQVTYPKIATYLNANKPQPLFAQDVRQWAIWADLPSSKYIDHLNPAYDTIWYVDLSPQKNNFDFLKQQPTFDLFHIEEEIPNLYMLTKKQQ